MSYQLDRTTLVHIERAKQLAAILIEKIRFLGKGVAHFFETQAKDVQKFVESDDEEPDRAAVQKDLNLRNTYEEFSGAAQEAKKYSYALINELNHLYRIFHVIHPTKLDRTQKENRALVADLLQLGDYCNEFGVSRFENESRAYFSFLDAFAKGRDRKRMLKRLFEIAKALNEQLVEERMFAEAYLQLSERDIAALDEAQRGAA